MPITTPETFFPDFLNDEEHFTHVLKMLFIPAIEKQGFKPIPPRAKGSEVIQGNIINQLIKSDLVLADMSILNPNVFFEIGIRTSLNKPICMVVDEKTKDIPFDTKIIHYHKYSSALNSWDLKKEIDKLAEHIEETVKKSKGQNAMWKYFGISTTAQPPEKAQGIDSKFDFISTQIQALRSDIRDGLYSEDYSESFTEDELEYKNIEMLKYRTKEYFEKPDVKAELDQVIIDKIVNNAVIQYKGNLSYDQQFVLQQLFKVFDCSVAFHNIETP